MIDEKKLLDWLTQRKNDSLGADRLVYRQLLSRIENGEFEQGNTIRQSSWSDDDSQW